MLGGDVEASCEAPTDQVAIDEKGTGTAGGEAQARAKVRLVFPSPGEALVTAKTRRSVLWPVIWRIVRI